MGPVRLIAASALWISMVILSVQGVTTRSFATADTDATPPPNAESVAQGRAGGATILAEADGPDFWAVTGVPAGDTLNVRSGPGTSNPVIARAQNGQVFRNLGCRMTGSTRWCEVETRDGALRGWVSGHYLRETGGGGTVGGGSGGSTVPELAVRSTGEIEVRWASGCTILYNPRGGRIQSGGSCSTSQRGRSDDAVARYLREQGGGSAEGGGAGGTIDMRGFGAVTGGGSTTGQIISRNGRTYAVIISASQDGFTCTGSSDAAPGSRQSMSTPINCTNGATGSAILGARSDGYLLTFSTMSGSGGYVRFR